MSSVFVGLETIEAETLRLHSKRQNLAQLRRRDPPLPRPRRDGQWQLRLRPGRRSAGRLRPHRGLGRLTQLGNRDLPHHDPVPGHRPAHPHEPRKPDHRNRLGSLRHTTRRLPTPGNDPRPTRSRLLEGIPRLLPLARNHSEEHADKKPRNSDTSSTPAAGKNSNHSGTESSRPNA